jgi:hypothetical protein
LCSLILVEVPLPIINNNGFKGTYIELCSHEVR